MCSLLQFETPSLAHANSQPGVSVCCVQVGVLVALAPQARVLHMHKQTTSATTQLKEAGGMGRRKINRCQMSSADRRSVL